MDSVIKLTELHYSFQLVSLFFILVIFAIKLYTVYQGKSKLQAINWTASSYQHKTNKSQIRRGIGFNSFANEKVEHIQTLALQIENTISDYAPINILKQLSLYRLINLNRLDLRNNKIQSIQSLALCQLPSLQFLTLTNNLLFCLKSLRRIEAQNIIWLQLSNNPLTSDFSFLSEMSLPNMQFIWIQFFGTDLLCNSNINWVAKCESQVLQKFHVNSYMRVLQVNTISVLKHKYDKLDIRIKEH